MSILMIEDIQSDMLKLIWEAYKPYNNLQKRNRALAALKGYEERRFEELVMLFSEIQDATKSELTRDCACKQLRQSLVSLWQSIEDNLKRRIVDELLVTVSSSPGDTFFTFIMLIISDVAIVDLKTHQWPILLDGLFNLFHSLSGFALKKVFETLVALVCSNNDIKLEHVGKIISAIVEGLNAGVEVKVLCFKSLSSISSTFYAELEEHVNSIVNQTPTSQEGDVVVKEAILFWISVCKKEMSISADEVSCLRFTKRALRRLLPILVVETPPDLFFPEFGSELSAARVTCLSLSAQLLGEEIVEDIVLFLGSLQQINYTRPWNWLMSVLADNPSERFVWILCNTFESLILPRFVVSPETWGKLIKCLGEIIKKKADEELVLEKALEAVCYLTPVLFPIDEEMTRSLSHLTGPLIELCFNGKVSIEWKKKACRQIDSVLQHIPDKCVWDVIFSLRYAYDSEKLKGLNGFHWVWETSRQREHEFWPEFTREHLQMSLLADGCRTKFWRS